MDFEKVKQRSYFGKTGRLDDSLCKIHAVQASTFCSTRRKVTGTDSTKELCEKGQVDMRQLSPPTLKTVPFGGMVVQGE